VGRKEEVTKRGRTGEGWRTDERREEERKRKK
jgi:hypothetical protein